MTLGEVTPCSWPQVCDKVPVKTARYAEVPVCVAVPRYECQPVLREVPDTQCEDETYQKCYKVPNQVTHAQENASETRKISIIPAYIADCAGRAPGDLQRPAARGLRGCQQAGEISWV